MKLNISIPASIRVDPEHRSLVPLKSVIYHFLNQTIEDDALYSLLNRKKGKWIFTSQMTSVLWELGLSVKYFSRESLDPYLQTPEYAEDYIRHIYGKNAPVFLEKFDMPFIVESTKRLVNLSIFEHHELQFSDIEHYVNQGVIPLVVVDENILNNNPGPYSELLVLVNGTDDESVFFYDVDSHGVVFIRKIPKADFIRARNVEATDGIVLAVFGKRAIPKSLSETRSQVRL